MTSPHDESAAGDGAYYENSAGQYIFITPEENILIHLRKKLGLDYRITLIIAFLIVIAFFIAVIAVAVFVFVSSMNSEEHSLLTGIVVAIIFCGADALALAVIFAILKAMLGEKLLITPEEKQRREIIMKVSESGSIATPSLTATASIYIYRIRTKMFFCSTPMSLKPKAKLIPKPPPYSGYSPKIRRISK